MPYRPNPKFNHRKLLDATNMIEELRKQQEELQLEINKQKAIAAEARNAINGE